MNRHFAAFAEVVLTLALLHAKLYMKNDWKTVSPSN